VTNLPGGFKKERHEKVIVAIKTAIEGTVAATLTGNSLVPSFLENTTFARHGSRDSY
jgi:hypothetical protein